MLFVDARGTLRYHKTTLQYAAWKERGMKRADFAYQYERYLAEARLARENDLHHDQRRELFLTFLDKAFGIDLSR